MTDEERKKVALRFLKETGMLRLWKKYIQDCPENKHGAFCNWKITKDNWYKKECISGINWKNKFFEEYSVFGNTCFTGYLLRNGVSIDNNFFCYYATYITEKGYVPKGIWRNNKYASKEELLEQFPNIEL